MSIDGVLAKDSKPLLKHLLKLTTVTSMNRARPGEGSGGKWRKHKSRIVSYLKKNPGALFIISFQIMLVTCAILMASGNETAANELAIYAFYALVIGVILQFAAFLKHDRE